MQIPQILLNISYQRSHESYRAALMIDDASPEARGSALIQQRKSHTAMAS